jgi:glycosyltransferase involved in cell wall biosynthesis
MAMERLILLGVDGESRKIVEASGGGVFVEPESAEQLAEAVLGVGRERGRVEGMGRSGGEFVRKHYSRDKLAMDYLEVLCRAQGRRLSSAAGRTAD